MLGRAGPIPFTGRDADSARWVSGQAVFNALSPYRAGDRRGFELLGMGRCYDDY